MLDNDRDRDIARYQLFVVMFATLAVMAWFYYFTPPPAPPPEREQETAEETVQFDDPFLDPEPARAEPGIPGERPGMLPPVADDGDPERDEVILRDEALELAFTRVGARLKRATVLLGEDGRDSVQLVPEWPGTPDANAVLPLGLRFTDPRLGDELDRRRWEAEVTPDGRAVTFSLEAPGLARVTKTFRLTGTRQVLEAEVGYTNLEDDVRLLGMDTHIPAYSLNWGPNVVSGDLDKGIQQDIVWRKDGVNKHHATSRLQPAGPGAYIDQVRDPAWVAIKSAYFVVAMRAEYGDALTWISGTPNQFRVGIGAPRMELAPGETDVRRYQLYVGPTHLGSLQAAWPELDEVLQFFTWFGIMDWFAKLLLGVLNWFHGNAIANYGLAIIFLTVLVRVVMFPLTWKSMVSMRKMQLLMPEMEKIKAEVGENDPQELQKRTMALYQEYGVNPLGGCLPMLLQMPVFFALYRMLWSAFELRRAPFAWWIEDLSEPDRFIQFNFSIPMPFGLSPLDGLNLLPILMAVAMLVSMKIMPTSGAVQTQQQKIIMTVMPIIFAVVCYNMASGLNLYILTSTLLGIGQNYLMHFVNVKLEPRQKKKTEQKLKKPKHFYAAAQARKRKLAKEARQERRRPAQTAGAKREKKK